MIVRTLCECLDYRWVKGSVDIDIAGIAYDSREVQEGYLFVAIRGLEQDGHDFIEDAIQRGAVFVVGEDEDCITNSKVTAGAVVPDSRLALSALASCFYGHPSQKISLIGVTGTNGKTSTTTLLKTILRSSGHKTGLFGTIENSLNDEILPAKHTTPESKELHEMLALLVEKGATYAVMEVSSHALALKRVHDCDFNVGVFTNLTQDHLDFHDNMEDYFLAKKILFDMIDSKYKEYGDMRYVVLNRDDPYSKRIAKNLACKVIYYGIHKKNPDYQARNIRMGLNGTFFEIKHPHGLFELHLTMTGVFSVYNCLAAVAVAMEEGIEPEIIIRALEETKVPGRFEPINEGQKFAVVVDYAHTPDSLENAIKTAQEVTENRVITVFGCGGDRDRGKRPIMGNLGVSLSDVAIITSDNPRTEDPQAIIQDILEGVESTNEYQVIVDRKEAIRIAVAMAKTGDLVLIAGKGHEDYQIIGHQKYPFSDILIAREAIKERTEF